MGSRVLAALAAMIMHAGLLAGPAAAAPQPEQNTGLQVVAAQLKAATARTAQRADALHSVVLRYQAAVHARTTAKSARQKAVAGPGVHRALQQLGVAFAGVQESYWPVAQLVAATPALAGLDLGAGSSRSARVDDRSHPLNQLAALLGPSRNITAVPSAPALVEAGTDLASQAQRLAQRASPAMPTSPEILQAVQAALAVVSTEAQSWAQEPTGPAPDLTHARVTVAGLIDASSTLAEPVSGAGSTLARPGSDASDLSALLPGMRYVRWLLTLPMSDPATRAVVAHELAWSVTDLAAHAARSSSETAAAGGEEGKAAPAAEAIKESLFHARWELAMGRPEAAAGYVQRGRRLFARTLASELTGGSIPTLFDEAERAVRRGDQAALAVARGAVIAAIMTGAYELTLRAVEQDHLALAREWVAVRDLEAGLSPNGIQDDARQAVSALLGGTMTSAEAALAVKRDELDGLQRRTVTLVQQATLAGYLGVAPTVAETAALSAGYWRVLSPIYSRRLGARASGSVDAAFATLDSPRGRASRFALQSADGTALGALGSFTAAPATEAEQEQRVRRLVEAMRFTIARLCGANVVPPSGEPVGTAAGPPVVMRLINDLQPTLNPADAARLANADQALATLPGASGISGEESSPKTYHQSEGVRSACARATTGISTVFPAAWKRHGDDADFERIDQDLARVRTAAAQHNWGAAGSQAREAYAIFDLTPELRLLAVDPGLAVEIEALFWNGGSDGHALFDALSDHASAATLHARQTSLEEALDRAQIVLDVSHSATEVAVNSGIVVFREGLEALLIIAALSASFVTGGRRWRRPVIAGAVAAVPATFLTWALSSAILGSFVGYELQLQAVLDIAALAVLGVMLAWFFQKFCWTRFVAKEHARSRRMADRAPLGSLLGPSLGLAALGFTVIYREGFETVLYLQALRQQAGSGAVIEGVLLGLLFTTAIGVLMLLLRRRLPYRRVVVGTATLVGLLGVIMTGQTVRALQAVGWLSITPVHFDLPVWTGQWLGLYPSLETLLAQAACAIAIPIAAVLTERFRTRRLQRRIEAARERAAKERAAKRSARERTAVEPGSAQGAQEIVSVSTSGGVAKPDESPVERPSIREPERIA